MTTTYNKVCFIAEEETIRSILLARLSEEDYEGFEETDDYIIAYIPEDKYDQAIVTDLAEQFGTSYEIEKVAPQNWNAIWEADFEPVIVGDFCTVRAVFHDIPVQTQHEIIITPKMSFGTGHHATTKLMMQMMEDISFADKQVFDFGTGTGILAILAEKLGAGSVVAIDNDEWAYNNAIENIEENGCSRIDMSVTPIEHLSDKRFDVILANINRHILLQYMMQLVQLLSPDGFILMSGLLQEDKPTIVAAAADAGLKLVNDKASDNWIALLFEKIDKK